MARRERAGAAQGAPLICRAALVPAASRALVLRRGAEDLGVVAGGGEGVAGGAGRPVHQVGQGGRPVGGRGPHGLRHQALKRCRGRGRVGVVVGGHLHG